MRLSILKSSIWLSLKTVSGRLALVFVTFFMLAGSTQAANLNEPGGMTQKMDEAWDAVPPSSYPGDNGGWWCDSGSCSPYSILNDSGAPTSPPNVLRLTFQGSIGGGSPAHSYFGYPSALMPNTGLIYNRIRMRVSSNWTDAGNVGTKFFFPRANAANENSYIGLTNFGTASLHWSENGQGWNTQDYYAMSGSLSKGVWHDVEILLYQGTTSTSGDGYARIWVDGTQVLNQSGLQMMPSGTKGFGYIFYDPTFGGGLNNPPAPQFLDIDHWYVSVQASGGGDTTAPTGVAITAPSNGATVSGSSTTVTASCSDNVAVSSVQMLLDGSNLGSQDTTSPYSITWNTTGASNGSHTLSARCTDTSSNQTTSSTINVTVSNTAPSGECPSNWKSLNPTWLWCDDFETDESASWFDRNGATTFLRNASAAQSGSFGMRATYPATTGVANAGDFKIAFGSAPVTPKVDTADNTKYTEIYWRTFIKTSANWLPGTGAKFTRATGFVASDWTQSFITHWWDSSTSGVMMVDPASGVCRGGLKPNGTTVCTNNTVITSGWNDFNNLYWLGGDNGTLPVFANARANTWQCIEGHTKLNTAGSSNGLEELWVDGTLEAQSAGLNLVGTYSTYGINVFSVENYMNAGTDQSQYRDWDNLVVATTRVGCTVGGGSDTTAPAAPTGLGVN
ncbi:MAG: Ig-like domain-containing protein [Candidatus Moraniibacteriota bacterium]